MLFNSFSYDRNLYKKKNVVTCVYVLKIMEISEAVEPISKLKINLVTNHFHKHILMSALT